MLTSVTARNLVEMKRSERDETKGATLTGASNVKEENVLIEIHAGSRFDRDKTQRGREKTQH